MSTISDCIPEGTIDLIMARSNSEYDRVKHLLESEPSKCIPDGSQASVVVADGLSMGC